MTGKNSDKLISEQNLTFGRFPSDNFQLLKRTIKVTLTPSNSHLSPSVQMSASRPIHNHIKVCLESRHQKNEQKIIVRSGDAIPDVPTWDFARWDFVRTIAEAHL